MSITPIELEENEISCTRVLAGMILGHGRGQVVQDTQKRRSVGFRLDPSLVDEIDDFAKKAGITRTSVVEMLLISGIRSVKEQLEIIEEFEESINIE